MARTEKNKMRRNAFPDGAGFFRLAVDTPEC